MGVVMSEIFPQIGYQVGIGAVGGFVVGFAVKKIGKLVAVLAGLIIIGLIYLSTSGIIAINYSALWDALAKALGVAQSAFSWLVGVISLLPFAATFVGGFLLGLKLG
jgi:uncharacterized membrane protein (Fun14 family)